MIAARLQPDANTLTVEDVPGPDIASRIGDRPS